MKKNYLLIPLLFFAFNILAQPTRIWGTYYGDAQNDIIRSTAIDANGNVLVCGYSASTVNIATIGSQQALNAGLEDAFIAKFDSAGVRLWATYFGGPDIERANSICVDGNGNIYIAGYTSSSISISTAGCHQPTYGDGTDAFLAKYNNAGVLQWATYYGGSGYETGWSVAVDGVGNVYLGGTTSSTNNISSPGSHQVTYGGGINDAFMVKFNSAGVRQWGTYYGGLLEGFGGFVATDAVGNVYLTGGSNSTNAISTAGSHQVNLDGGIQSDGYLAKFNGSGIRLWATYYGGLLHDEIRSAALDQSGNVYLAGHTTSTNNISTAGCHQFSLAGFYDGFLVKFNSSGVRQWGTYYGGSGTDIAYYVGVDATGNVFVAGDNQSPGGIGTAGSHQPIFGGNIDGYAAKFNTAGVRQWGTYYGGTVLDRGFSMGMDQIGNIYLGGQTNSANAISTPSCHQLAPGGGIDGYLVRFADCSGPPDPAIIGPTVVCQGAGATVYSVAPGAISYTWVLPGGWSGSSATNTISASPGSSGTFSVIASNMCGTSAQNTLNITVSSLPTITVNSGSICSGNSFTMVPGGASTYTFQGGNAVVSPTANTSYTIIGTNSVGCVSQTFATSNVTVNLIPLPTITVNSGSICSGQSFTIVPGGANTYTFQGGNSVVSPTVNSSYTVIGTNTAGCVSSSAAVSNITVSPLPILITSATPTFICVGETTTLNANGSLTYSWSPAIPMNGIVSPTTTTSYSVVGTNSNNCTSLQSVITVSVDLCTDLSSAASSNEDIKIYPNPGAGEFTINLNSISENTTIEIYNILGEIVFKTVPNRLNSIIKVDYLANGFYQLSITKNGKIISRKKIIKE